MTVRFFLLSAVLSVLLVHAAYAHEKVLLSQVTAITLRVGEVTNGRRVSAIPQLTCLRGCEDFHPRVVMCEQRGFDGRDATWKCEADLPEGMSFDELNVQCEGYAYPDDEYVLRGSCGLEFSLRGQVENGDRRKRTKQSSYYERQPQRRHRAAAYASTYSWGDIMMWGVIAFFCYKFYQSCTSSRSPLNNQGGRGGGPPGGPSTSTPGGPAAANAQGGGGGLFGGWGNMLGGLGTGALLGYMMGGGRQRGGYGRQRQQQQQQYYEEDDVDEGVGFGEFRGASAYRQASPPAALHRASGYARTSRR